MDFGAGNEVRMASARECLEAFKAVCLSLGECDDVCKIKYGQAAFGLCLTDVKPKDTCVCGYPC